MKKKVAFYTLGCKLNYSETSSISHLFRQADFEVVNFYEQAHVYVINTCSVTDNADKKCRKVVQVALRIAPEAYVAIVGCYAQLKPQAIAEIPGVAIILGASEKFQIVEHISKLVKTPKPVIYNRPVVAAKHFVSAYSLGDRTRTFLKVQDGCNYSCSFCTIPLARGSSRSGTVAHIVEQARHIVASEVKEIVLTGVNIGDFGLQAGKRQERLIDLLQAVDTIAGNYRIRISSVEPNLLTDAIITFVAYSRHFVPHFHIPLQSGSNRILSLMRRRYCRELYADRVRKIKQLMPDACVGVDVIVGFPGETNEDFTQTHCFLKELDVAYLHVFTYSERDHTPAKSMPGSLPKAIRAERSIILRNLSDKKRRLFYEKQLGKQVEVLFEEPGKDGHLYGLTPNYVRVKMPYDPIWINELKTMQLLAIAPDGYVTAAE